MTQHTQHTQHTHRTIPHPLTPLQPCCRPWWTRYSRCACAAARRSTLQQPRGEGPLNIHTHPTNHTRAQTACHGGTPIFSRAAPRPQHPRCALLAQMPCRLHAMRAAAAHQARCASCCLAPTHPPTHPPPPHTTPLLRTHHKPHTHTPRATHPPTQLTHTHPLQRG